MKHYNNIIVAQFPHALFRLWYLATNNKNDVWLEEARYKIIQSDGFPWKK